MKFSIKRITAALISGAAVKKQKKQVDFSLYLVYNSKSNISRCDGIGRRDGLKIRW